MRWGWDWAKAQSNLRKHGIDFADAVGALLDPLALTMPDPEAEAEERWLCLGLDLLGRLLVVVYTLCERRIRIISARSATRRERRQYEES